MPKVDEATSFLDELGWRGLIQDRTAGDALDRHLAQPPRTAYCGFDPTSDNLHIGNFIPMKLLAHWQRCGHKPIVLMGGGTGLIGDPSGRDSERMLLDRDQVRANVEAQQKIFSRVLDFGPEPTGAVIVDNADWLTELKLIDVLRDVGKHFSINTMIQKDSIKRRLEEREQGISFTEFSYVILQAYDFLHLRREMNCTTQVAGSDQYGNIVAGIDLIRREFGEEAFGVTAPLVARSDGRKMSKSSGEALWLSAEGRERSSPYAFYQYWINLPDADVVQWLRWYTFLGSEEIDEIAARHEATPQERHGQRALARHMCELFHGRATLERVEAAAETLFGSGDLRSLDAGTLQEVFADVPHTTHDKTLLAGEGVSLVEILPQTTLAQSKREAREHLGRGAIAVNGTAVEADHRLTTADLLPGAIIVLRRGKKHDHATRWE
jgi:tyrosyl-tRNA synthetase